MHFFFTPCVRVRRKSYHQVVQGGGRSALFALILDMINIFRDAEGIATDMGLSGYVDCGSSLNKKTGVQSG